MRIQAKGVDSGESDYYSYVPTQAAAGALLCPLIVGELRFQPGYTLHHRIMDNYMIAYIDEGSFHIRYDGHEESAKAGQFILIDCRRPHDFWVTEDCRDIYLHFDGPAADGLCDYVTSRHGNIVTTAAIDTAVAGLSSILDIFRAGRAVDEVAVSHRIDGILCALAQGPALGTAQRNEAMLRGVMAYISEHLADNLSLGRLAEVACLGKYHLAKVFKAQVGVSPHRYILNARIERARYLLSYTTDTVQRIGRACGFEQSSSFCAAFRRETGISPSQYRVTMSE